ncbi:MAG: LamG domain-containing protein, partial [Candidatus Hydrogenedentes bacterium]|nr:LamG domain-containing protein [Candidatus Hydrogenedentota bacterium]
MIDLATTPPLRMHHGRDLFMHLSMRIFLAFAMVTFLHRVVAADTPWPAERGELLFAFSDDFTPSYAPGLDGKPLLGWHFTPTGYGRIRHDGALLLGRGGFFAEQIGAFLSASLQDGEGFTATMWLTPETRLEDGAVMTLGHEVPSKNGWLRIEQHGSFLRIGIATKSGPFDLLAADVKAAITTSITVSCNRTHAVIFRDGVEVARKALPAALVRPEGLTLRLGSSSPDVVGWKGAVEGICLYGRALSATEVRTLHDSTAQRRSQREHVPSLHVRAVLRGKSTVPTPEELAPYTQGLTVFLYEVVKVLSGDYDGSQLHVAHWTVLDERALAFASVLEGSMHELRLEPYDGNPQLAAENLSDDIVEDFTIPYFYDAGGRSLRDVKSSREE